MSESNSRPRPDILDQATGELRDTPGPPGPPAELTVATVVAIHNRLTGTTPGELARHERRRRIMRYVGFGSAVVATVAIAMTATLFWPGGSAAAHVQKALDNAEKAKSVKVIVTVPNVEMQGKMTHVATLFRKGDMIRKETMWMPPDVPVKKPVVIADLKTRKMLILLPETKTAQRGTVEATESRAVAAMLGNFAEMKAGLAGGDDKAIKAVGEEEIGGRKTKVYELTVKPARLGVWKVWVDPKTELPVRLANAEAGHGLTLDFEDWNKDFDAKLFSMDVPEGYKLTEEPKKEAPAPEEDGRTVFIKFVQPAVDLARKTRAVVYTRTNTYPKEIRNEKRPAVVATEYIQDGAARVEMSNGVKIMADNTLLWVIHSEKTYWKEPFKGKHPSAADTLNQFLEVIKDENAKDLGDEAIGEVLARKYEMQLGKPGEPGAGTGTIWIDPKTGFPAKVHFATEDGTQTVTFEKFRWNPKLDSKLFSLDPPEGYKLREK